jgi:CRP-like cAMP-binding protein
MSDRTDIRVLPALLNTYLFEVVSPADLERLLGHVTARLYDQGEYVFTIGEAATHLHVVAQGKLKESMTTLDGDEVVFELVLTGGVVGEPGLFAPEGTRIADLVALEPSVVINIEKVGLIDFLFRHPPAMLRMLGGLAEQVRSAAEDMGVFAFRDIRQRLVLKLLDIAENFGQATDKGMVINLRLSQSILAGLIGATRENVNRTLKTLSASGHVLISGPNILVPNTERLRELAGGGYLAPYRRNSRQPR